MEITYEFRLDMPSKDDFLRTTVIGLLATVLESSPIELSADLTYQEQRGSVQLWMALSNGRLVGCKLGYERKPSNYYSWLGGVHPEFRGRGIARELLHQQHMWCQRQKYSHVRTQTFNHWRSMLLLNLQEGFDIVGTVLGPRGLVVVLEKEL